MAKKKKVQDTSPLAMGRQQKGSAANKRVQKTGTNTKSQSSVSQKDRINQKNYGTTTPNVRRATAPTSRSTASNNRAEQRQIQPTARKTTNAPTAASMNRQRQQQQQNRLPATAAEMRRQNADRNMNLKQTKAATAREMTAQRKLEAEKAKQQNTAEWNTVKNKSKEEQQKWFTQKAQEAQKRNTGKVEKGTDNLATSAAKAAFHSGKGAVHSLFGAATRASIEDEYDTQKDKALASIRGEDVNKAEKAAREKAQQRKELKLAGIREKTRIEQEKAQEIQDAEAAKDKGPIPLRKMAVGAASFTGQRLVDSAFGPYSLASMGARVIEDERNSAKEKNDKLKQKLAESGQFTQEELDNEFQRMDRRSVANAYASAGIEVLSELMFGGIGLSKKYIPEGASGFLDKAAGKLLGKVGSTAAGKLALGIGEETLEEWIANPIQAAVSNRLTGNKLQSLQEESVRREYQKQAMDLREIKATSADINSQAFLERAKEIYKESGASDEEASRIAELARDYFNADITGDNKTAEAKLKEITGILAGGENDLREKWTLRDALEVAGEMIMSVGAEATPGAITSSMAGNDYKANYGIEGVRKLAKVVENLDTDKSDRAKAIIDDIDKGKDLTGTQVSEIMQWSSQAAQKAQEREASRDDLVRNRMKAEKLSVPIVDAEYNLAPATEERFEQIVDRVADTIQDDMKLGMSDVDAYAIGDVVAAFETGTISAEQMNELNIENPEARAVFEKETGINLDEYTVKDKKGNIKVAASNTDMQEALFSKAADNYIESAKIEQEYWNDTARGEMEEELTSNVAGADFKGRGRAAVLAALRTADPQDRGQFMLTGSAARRVYEAGRFSNDSWDDVKGDFKSMFNEVDEATLRNVFEAAKEDKAIEETDGYGKRVKAGDKISRKSLNSGEQVVVPGSFDNKSKRKLGEAEKAVLIDIANEFNLQIEMSDDPKVIKNSENGIYDPNNNKIILNAANTMEENLTFALSHEVTHHLAVTAPEQYLKLSNYLMDKAYKSDSEGFQAQLQSIQDQYYEHTKNMDKPQKLTPEQAFEEIIANNAHEFWTDEGFAEDVCREEPSLAEAIIDAIKNVLTKIRNILSSGNVTNDTYRDTLFGEVEVYDAAYKLYKRTYQAAKKVMADEAIDNWQDEVNEQYDTRHSLNTLPDGRRFVDVTAEQDVFDSSNEADYPKIAKKLIKEKFGNKVIGIDNPAFVNSNTAGEYSHSSKTITGEEYNAKMRASSELDNLVDAAQNIRTVPDGADGHVHKDAVGGFDHGDTLFRVGGRWFEGRVNLENNKIGKRLKDVTKIKDVTEDILDSYGDNPKFQFLRTSSMNNVTSPDSEIKYSLSDKNLEDADYMKAVESGDMEAAQRMVDEAAKSAGYDTSKKLYHGTDAEFNVFEAGHGQYGNGVYLTYDEKMAKEYGKNVLSFYTVPLKTAHWDELGDTLDIEDLQAYWEDAESRPEEFPENDATNLEYHPESINALIEAGYDSFVDEGNDGIVIFPTEAGGIDSMVKSADPVTYDNDGNVIPLSQRFNTESDDVRFSLSASVEQNKDLIAVHNLTADKLRGDFRLGGFPMPSIAVTNQNHEHFGDISLLFGSSTIDPKKDRANKVYSADAWTPTVPMTEYEADYDVASKVMRTVKELVEGSGVPTQGMSADLHPDNIQDSLGNERGFDGFISRIMNKPYIKYAFLKSQGEDIEVPYKEGSLQGHGKAVWEKIDEALPEMTRSEAYNMDYDEAMKLEPIIRNIVAEDWINLKSSMGIDEEKVRNLNPYKNEWAWGKVTNYLADLVKFRESGKDIQVVDEKALEDVLDEKINKDAYREWTSELFDGIIKDSGVRNQADIFTPSGNRRSFKATHYPATLDGILKAMKEQGEKNVSWHTSTKTLRADTAKTFKSLDEIRDEKGKLKNLSEEDVENIYKELDDKFYEILNNIGEQSSKEYDLYAADIIADVISECAQAGYTSPEQIIKHFGNYEWTVTEQDAEDILALFDAIQNMPVNMFEAKPRRAVGFDEVKAAIVPEDTSEDVIKGLEDRGVPVTTYNAEVEGDRVAKVNEAADELNLRFSISKDIMNTLEDNFNEYKEDTANLRIATEAIADLRGVSVTGENLSGQRWSLDETASQRRMDNRADSGISSARTIAKGITASLVNEGYIDFIGQKVESPEDLAKLGQVLRDPRFETFRLVLTKGNKIVSFQSCSARMPGLSPVHNEASDAVFYEKIKEQMNKLGADGYYLMHNHPSGDVTASEDDRRVTANSIFKLGGEAFKGHVILDHDKFGLISNVDVLSAPGSVSLTNMEAPIYGQQTIDLIHEPEIDHPLLGEKAKNGEIVASIGEKVNTSNDYSVVIYVSSKLEVRGIQEVSNKEIEKNLGKFKSFIREQGVEFGSVSALLYSPSGSDVSFSTIESLFEEGVILDAVYGDTHFFDLGLERYGDPSVMGRSRDEINSRITVYESVAGTQDYNSIRYSITPKMDADYMNAVNSNNMEEAQKLVNEAAKMAGYGLHVYHGTLSEPFTRFKRPAENWSSHGGGRPGFIYASVDEDYAAIYSFAGEPFSSDYEEGFVMEGYMNIDNMIDVGDVDGLIFKNNGWDHPDYENDPESLFSKDATKEFKNLCKVMDMTPYELVHALGEELYYDSENIYQLVNSPEFAQLIKDKGYDGIKLLESGSDAYGVLEPTQIKSADTVTYAEDGSIIPLSERFNPENDDIRYSLPTQNSQGNILSDGQMEYFKNSQARDKQDRLVRVYHSTDSGGFTVFDPSHSDDKRSIFFTSNYRMSQSYIKGGSYKDFNAMEFALPAIEPYSIMSMQDVVDYFASLSNNQKDEIGIVIYDSESNRYDSYTPATKNSSIEAFFEKYGDDFSDIEGYIEDRDGTIGKFHDKNELFNELEDCVKYINRQFGEQGRGDSGTYSCYLNLENPMIIDCKGANWDSISEDGFEQISVLKVGSSYDVVANGDPITLEEARSMFGDEMVDQIEEYDDWVSGEYHDFYTWDGAAFDPEVEGYWPAEGDTRYWCLEAEARGFDGVIFLNLSDNGSSYSYEIGDVYVAFSSNQIKDINNLNPTEHSDIRYSIVNEDDAKSKMAYDEAMDNSYEALEYYEQRIADLTDEAAENRPVKKFSEEKIEEFYAGLRSTDSWVHTDPIAEEDAVRMANSKKDFFANLNAKWNDRWTTGGEVLNVKSVKTDVRNLVMGVMQNSDTDSKYRNDLVKKTLFDVRTAFQLMKQDRPEVASALLYHSAQRMIDNVQFYVDGTFDQYKDLKHYLRTTKISLGEEYWSDVDYDAFRKRNYNRINLVKGKTNVDQVYQELEEMFPEFFNGEETMSVPDQLLQMEEVLDTVQPYTEAYSSEAAAELAFDIADDLYEIMVNGDEVRSLADRYKDRYDAKTRAMKQRHAEAMLRVRKARDEGIKKEKARFTEYKEKQKEKKLHSKHFDSINKNYKWLRERLLTNTKDKHIPEQYKKDLAGLLAAFDLQTVGSKKLEAKRGYQSQKTIQMSAIRSGLDAMHKAYETFFVHDAITDKIDALASQVDGKTIDELSVDQLSEIDDILKGLKSDFINYDKIMVKGKQRAAADVGKAQTQGALKHAEQFGAGKDYQNLPGVIDKLINLDEMTAPYMFRKIDPNNEGLGMMYGEIRRGFDKYVRNQNQLNDWMDEIVGKYHQKGILWNKYGSGELSDWRSDTHAVTFNFEHGAVRLTPAQMMSIYCLAKRPQAYQHMISEYGGIVAAPVTFNAKILSDIKKSVNTALSVPLTDADIKQIVAELTPDQIQVAEKLQELMATKMADWGNEASMDVMGIELFKEREYFPIKSDSAVLQKDLNDSEFVQAIRNFGFTKALTPNANNAIVVEDIFDVVTEHCNNMNLYNAYSKAFDDFMKVYNYKDFGEGGTGYTVQQAVAHAYSKKATTFIMTFLRDLNGNVSGRASGIEDAYNSLLGNAKKAAVFANLRVAAQQPTAITRAFYVIDPKYMKGIKIEKGAMTEMFEHCPIALWKSWGYYDINMGKSIEDIMMNNGRWLEDKATDLYGALDNVTWTAIWQMVKNEMKDTHPDVKEGTDEYWDLCNERMSEVVDLTQVVDSPLHRSHAMRDKGFLKKTATSFMAEPTLTFNMLRDGCERSAEARRMGKILLAGQIASRTIAVALFQAVTVAGAAGLVDALRKKNPDKDDEDDSFLHLWWVNALENFKDELKVWNKIYFIKDIASLMEGWDNANLALQGIQKFSLGWRQLQGDPYARSSAGWYENMADGLGYMFGVPVKTMRTGIKNVMEALGITSPVIDATKESLDAIADNNKKKQKEEKGTMVGKLTSDEFKIEGKGLFGKLLKKADEKETGSSEANAEGSKTYEEERDRLRDLEAKAKEKTQGLTGKELDDALWDVLSDGYTKELDAGNLDYIEHLELIYMNAGGDTELFRAKIKEKIGSSYKKTFADNMSQEDLYAQDRMRHYMEELLDFSEDEVSAICYKTDKARDLKVAFRLNNEQYINDEMSVLVRAGLTQADLEKLYKNRNRMNLKTYNGKYKDQLKSTGKYVFPVEGIITSDFGHRASPGGIGSTNHQGIDIGAKSGTPVGAADGGTVVMAGWYGGYGKTVQVKHDDGTITQYSHLSWWDVNVGDTVGQGQEIGLVGSTGNSTGPHLHLGVIKEGKYVDPKQYFNTRDKSWAADA